MWKPYHVCCPKSAQEVQRKEQPRIHIVFRLCSKSIHVVFFNVFLVVQMVQNIKVVVWIICSTLLAVICIFVHEIPILIYSSCMIVHPVDKVSQCVTKHSWQFVKSLFHHDLYFAICRFRQFTRHVGIHEICCVKCDRHIKMYGFDISLEQLCCLWKNSCHGFHCCHCLISVVHSVVYAEMIEKMLHVVNHFF